MSRDQKEIIRQIFASRVPQEAAAEAGERCAKHFGQLQWTGIVRIVQEVGYEQGLSDSECRHIRLELFRLLHGEGGTPKKAGERASSNTTGEIARADKRGGQAAARAGSDAADETAKADERGGQAAARASPDGACEIAAAMVQGLYEAIPAGKRRDFHQAMVDNLRESPGLPGELVTLFKDWTGDGPPTLSGDEAMLQQVAHAAYLAACDAAGPSGADRALGQAIRYCETLPAARDYPPRRLL